MPLQRTTHWLTRELDTFLRENANAKFEWGALDCSLFAADAIKAMTGVDIAEDFRDKYHDEASAFALIKTITGGTTVTDAAAYCANKHGLTEWKYPLQAQRGDLVVVDNAGNLIAGIVDLTGKYVAALGESGIIRISTTHIKRAWHV
jgi:hypothetical protein